MSQGRHKTFKVRGPKPVHCTFFRSLSTAKYGTMRYLVKQLIFSRCVYLTWLYGHKSYVMVYSEHGSGKGTGPNKRFRFKDVIQTISFEKKPLSHCSELRPITMQLIVFKMIGWGFL